MTPHPRYATAHASVENLLPGADASGRAMTEPGTQLVSRQANGIAPAHPAQGQLGQMSLSEIERVCNMIATGGDLVPVCYRNKPGAVYLTLMWARKHNVDELTAIQNIVPINGKPFVQSELHREVMEGKGYAVEVVESTGSRCEIDIIDPRGRTRKVVAALPDAAEERGDGLIFVQPGDEFKKNALWTTRRSDMLYALAIRIGDRRIVGSGAAGVDASQDYAPEPDALDVMAPQASPEPAQDDAEVVDAELVPDDPAEPVEAQPAPVAVDADEVRAEREQHLLATAERAGIKGPKSSILRQASEIARHAGVAAPSTISSLCRPEEDTLYQAVLDWIEAQ